MLADLTHPLHTGMPVYPGDPEVTISPALTAPRDGVNVLALHLGSQSGTHVDAPSHVQDGLPGLDDLPLDRFTGPAVLLDARELAPRTPLGASVLEPVAHRLAPGSILLVVTGWSRYWATPEYAAHPYPDPGFAERLVTAGIRTVGLDTLSADRTPPPGEPLTGLPTHLVLAAAGCVIAENLTGLEPLLAAQEAGARIEVSLFPLHLPGADGAPVRAIARITPPGEPPGTR